MRATAALSSADISAAGEVALDTDEEGGTTGNAPAEILTDVSVADEGDFVAAGAVLAGVGLADINGTPTFPKIKRRKQTFNSILFLIVFCQRFFPSSLDFPILSKKTIMKKKTLDKNRQIMHKI